MRRLSSSYNNHNISDSEIDEVVYGHIHSSMEVPLERRDHGERILYIGITSERVALVEIGLEIQGDELIVFHAREAIAASMRLYEEKI
jgi:hypothetical protein